MAQRIIIRKGLINPNATSIVEVPQHLKSSSVVVVTPKPKPVCGTSTPHHHAHNISFDTTCSDPSNLISSDSSSFGYDSGNDILNETVSDPSSLLTERSFAASPKICFKRSYGPRQWSPSKATPPRADTTFPPAKSKKDRLKDVQRWDDLRTDEGRAELHRKMGIESPESKAFRAARPAAVERHPAPLGGSPVGDLWDPHRGDAPGPSQAPSIIDWKSYKEEKKRQKAEKKLAKLQRIEAAERNQLQEDLTRYQRARKRFLRDTHDVCALM